MRPAVLRFAAAVHSRYECLGGNRGWSSRVRCRHRRGVATPAGAAVTRGAPPAGRGAAQTGSATTPERMRRRHSNGGRRHSNGGRRRNTQHMAANDDHGERGTQSASRCDTLCQEGACDGKRARLVSKLTHPATYIHHRTHSLANEHFSCNSMFLNASLTNIQ